jgi:hypothetical protein
MQKFIGTCLAGKKKITKKIIEIEREKLEKREKMRETYTSIPKVVVIYLLPHLHRMNIVRS